MASAKKDHLSGIKYPGVNDVLFGRGGNATLHPGNVQFRMLVETYKDQYAAASRNRKAQVANEVVAQWRSRKCPKTQVGGRFLTLTDPSKGDASPYHDVGDNEAAKKASQLLREKTYKNKSQLPPQRQKQVAPHLLPSTIPSLPSLTGAGPVAGVFPASVNSLVAAPGSRFALPPVGSSSVQPSANLPVLPQHLLGSGVVPVGSAQGQPLQVPSSNTVSVTHSQAAPVQSLVASETQQQQQQQQLALQWQVHAAELQVQQAQLQVQQQALLIQQAIGFQLAKMQQQHQQRQPGHTQQHQSQRQPQSQEHGQQLLQELYELQQQLAAQSSQAPAPEAAPAAIFASPVASDPQSQQAQQKQKPSELTVSNLLMQQLELFNQNQQQGLEPSEFSATSSSSGTGRSSSSIPRFIKTTKLGKHPGRTTSPSSSASEEPSSSDMMTGGSDSGSGSGSGNGDNSSENVVEMYTSATSPSRYIFPSLDEYPTTGSATGRNSDGNRNITEALQLGDSSFPALLSSSSWSGEGVNTSKKRKTFGVCFSDSSSNRSSDQNYTTSDFTTDSASETGAKPSTGAVAVSTDASSNRRSSSSSSSLSLKNKRRRRHSKRKGTSKKKKVRIL